VANQYIIYDEDNESIRRFQSKVDAEWFIRDKPEFTMKKIVEKRTKLQKMSDYEIAVKTCEPCLI
jgi:hypothetical protein